MGYITKEPTLGAAHMTRGGAALVQTAPHRAVAHYAAGNRGFNRGGNRFGINRGGNRFGISRGFNRFGFNPAGLNWGHLYNTGREMFNQRRHLPQWLRQQIEQQEQQAQQQAKQQQAQAQQYGPPPSDQQPPDDSATSAAATTTANGPNDPNQDPNDESAGLSGYWDRERYGERGRGRLHWDARERRFMWRRW